MFNVEEHETTPSDPAIPPLSLLNTASPGKQNPNKRSRASLRSSITSIGSHPMTLRQRNKAVSVIHN
jgi:hypothetical protein